MFEKVLTRKAIQVVSTIAPNIKNFYLAGGTGLALQLGHRLSEDLDFFDSKSFDARSLIHTLSLKNQLDVSKGTLHCEIQGVKLSFLYYKEPLLSQTHSWKNIAIADWQDITAEKIKTISQRGSKKDFYDLYTVLLTKSSIPETCDIFKRRFEKTGINLYHVVKSLNYFEDAEDEPNPVFLLKGKQWEWSSVKNYFKKNIKVFEKELLP